MSEYEFTILDWAAYAADLTERQQWLDWVAAEPRLPAINAQTAPPLTEMPTMMRRRVNRLGRFACQVAWWCQTQPYQAPMVFASRYGDAERSLALLGDLVQGQPLSPTAFGLSVHNAVSALYGIARAHTGNAMTVCAGRATINAALSEATSLLADGVPEVLVVFYEAPLPEQYAVFQDEDLAEYAWCWRLASAGAGPTHVRLAVQGADAVPASWPGGLRVLRQALSQVAAAPFASQAEVAHV